MDFRTPLYKASLISRTSLVLTDTILENGEPVTALCCNPTAMKTLDVAGSTVFLSFTNKPNRRLLYTWEISEANGTLVGVNIGRQKDLVLEAVHAGALYELSGYEKCEKIVPPMPFSYLDLKFVPFENSGYPDCYAAITPVYLKKGTDLLYPDTTSVANRHILNQLEQTLNDGKRTVLLLLAQRLDCLTVKADWTADPSYLLKLKELYDKGLEIICCGCTVSAQGIWITARLPFVF